MYSPQSPAEYILSWHSHTRCLRKNGRVTRYARRVSAARRSSWRSDLRSSRMSRASSARNRSADRLENDTESARAANFSPPVLQYRRRARERWLYCPYVSCVRAEHTLPLVVTIFLTGVYGGYFGAGQGVIMMALLATFLPDGLQRLNGLKNVLAVLINGVAAILFVAVAPVAWPPAILLAIGAIIGGQVGATVGRRLPAGVLRIAIIVIGTFVGVRLLIG